jgi:ubiquitin
MTRTFFVLLTGALSVAGVARAVISPVHSPYTTAPCLLPSQAVADLRDPNGRYADGGASCPSLCKKAGADCKQYVRASFACTNTYLADMISYEKNGCGIAHKDDPAAKNQCKSTADGFLKTYRHQAQDDRDQALGACEDWEATCKATCEP